TGSVVAFDGFLRVYREGRDNGEDEDSETILPDLKKGEAVDRTRIEPEQHFTQPPPRYGEASLVKRLEELGIGRPSTYASIISVLQDRDYVHLEKRRFVPEDRGRLVTAFLTSFFRRYVEYTFTADLEDKLDDISGGRIDWKAVLREFWSAFSKAVEDTRELRIRDVLTALDDMLGPHFFPEDAGGGDARACPSCDDGRLALKLGKFGAFIGCTNYPDCRHTRPLVVANGDEPSTAGGGDGPRALGRDPESGLEVSLRKGPYGFYVQLGEPEGKNKPKRASLPKDMDPAAVDLDRALALLALPREVGLHPETGEPIVAGIGRYGPYLRHAGGYVSLKGDDDVLTIGLNRAVTVIAEAPKKAPAKTLGKHPADGRPITQRSGRFGPYVQHGTVRANLPKGVSVDTLDLDAAIEILAAKAARAGKKTGRRKPGAGKSAGANSRARKTGARKTPKNAAPARD
ncbi:MAG: DNA topoisomerase, partial [Alphaproteobacteria bacterium]|nr:DNA topoisomerase [Alphaproteobacteria bacterium]